MLGIGLLTPILSLNIRVEAADVHCHNDGRVRQIVKRVKLPEEVRGVFKPGRVKL